MQNPQEQSFGKGSIHSAREFEKNNGESLEVDF
jgi:hypothetical protein